MNTILKLELLDKDKNCIAETIGEEEVVLSFRHEYEEGDHIRLSIIDFKEPLHLVIRIEDSLPECTILLKEKEWVFPIPFGSSRKRYGEKAFCGICHFGTARIQKKSEICNYRNLCLNAYDTIKNNTLYPLTRSNVFSENSQFYSCNAIDGIIVSDNHGSWPHSSWGISKRKDAWLEIDFGENVLIDRLVVYLRADFPHDSWWETGIIEFSDGKCMCLEFKKSGRRQEFQIFPQVTDKIILKNLIKAKDESEFPALSQIEAFGRVCLKK